MLASHKNHNSRTSITNLFRESYNLSYTMKGTTWRGRRGGGGEAFWHVTHFKKRITLTVNLLNVIATGTCTGEQPYRAPPPPRPLPFSAKSTLVISRGHKLHRVFINIPTRSRIRSTFKGCVGHSTLAEWFKTVVSMYNTPQDTALNRSNHTPLLYTMTIVHKYTFDW